MHSSQVQQGGKEAMVGKGTVSSGHCAGVRASVSSGGSFGEALTPVPGYISEKLWETVAVGFLLACHSTGGWGSTACSWW